METTTEEEFDIAALATESVERSKEELREGTVNEQQFLTFTIKNDLYGIDILHVKEILSHIEIARVPMTPEYIKGVMNLRGNVVPVIDLAKRFEQKTSQITRLTCIIVIELRQEGLEEKTDIGIVVDTIDQVVGIAENNMEKSPEFGAKIRPEFIDFMGKVEDSFIPVINITKVLNIEELSNFDIAKNKLNTEKKKLIKEAENKALNQIENKKDDNENTQDIKDIKDTNDQNSAEDEN
ncbi:MAG: chemotaxis protein CheW [Spirochaetia bacterium]|nr:chemotaxis protein CheW [Spirochaetia bacterium]